MSLPKYDKDAPFCDPVLRCDSCVKMVYAQDLRSLGMCRHCGNRRVRSLNILNDEERQELIDNNVDPDFIALFGEVSV